jgi:hypothetical protein
MCRVIIPLITQFYVSHLIVKRRLLKEIKRKHRKLCVYANRRKHNNKRFFYRTVKLDIKDCVFPCGGTRVFRKSHQQICLRITGIQAGIPGSSEIADFLGIIQILW